MKILLIEDDQELAAILSATLSKNNCVVDTVADGEMGLDMVSQWTYDAILLDVMLPRLDGVSVCRQLRQQGCATPIVMLTAQSSTEAVVTGLDAGADDYVIKPVDPQQVLARLRALQRRQTPTLLDNVFSWGGLTLNPVLSLVTYKDQEIPLSPKEYALLELFLRNPRRIFSRSEVIDRLWTIDDAPSEPTVTNLVKDLRRKLKKAGLTHDPVETLHGMGYRLKSSPPLASAAPAVVSKSQQHEPATSTLEDIAAQFQAGLQTKLAPLYALESALQAERLTADQQAQARAAAHQLTGSLGTFGYAQGSDLVRAIEHLLMVPFPLAPESATRFQSLLASLRQVLAQPPSFAAAAVPPKVGRTILVIDQDRNFTAGLATVTADLPFALTIAADHATAYHNLATSEPDLVIMNLGATASRQDTLTFLADLNTDFPDLPVLVLADQNTLEGRRAVTAYQVQRFIVKPIKPLALLAIITQVLAEAQPNTTTAIIVDDDPMILTSLSSLLLGQGIQTTCLLNPSQFWHLAQVVNPALLLLDLEMPGCNGLELCKTVRQDAKYRNLPILMITAHTDPDSVQQAFAAGADEVLPKPVPEDQLLTRIHQYLNRRHLEMHRYG